MVENFFQEIWLHDYFRKTGNFVIGPNEIDEVTLFLNEHVIDYDLKVPDESVILKRLSLIFSEAQKKIIDINRQSERLQEIKTQFLHRLSVFKSVKKAVNSYKTKNPLSKYSMLFYNFKSF